MSKRLIVIGAGETANLAHEYFMNDSNYEVVAFSVHSYYRKDDYFKNLPLIDLEKISVLYPKDDFLVFVALASEKLNYNRTRVYQEVKKMGYKCASYVSSRAFIWHNVKIGENCFILENNTLQPFVEIGNNVILWSGNHIGHQSIIKDNVFISSHVVISGFCEVGENTFIGVNSCVADNVKVAKDNFIGLGSVINKNTEENKIYRGNPAEASKIPAKKFCKVEVN